MKFFMENLQKQGKKFPLINFSYSEGKKNQFCDD